MSSADDTIGQLFALVDQDNDGVLDFAEVTALFQQLAPNKSVESAQNAAVESLLMADRSMDSKLNRNEFALMLAKVAEVSGLPVSEAAQRLLDVTEQTRQPPPTVPPPDILQVGETPVTDAAPPAAPPAASPAAPPAAAPAAAAAADADADAQPASDQSVAAPSPAAAVASDKGPAPAAAQLRKLFDSWDKAGDGRINFDELCQGLGKMRRSIKHKKDITSLITEAGSVLAAHDVDGDRQLDYQEFTNFISQFMAAAGFQLTDVLDDLVTLAQTKPDNETLQKVLDAAQPQIQRVLSS